MATGARRYLHVCIFALTLFALVAPIVDFASAQDTTPAADQAVVSEDESPTPEPTTVPSEEPAEVVRIETETPTQEPTAEPTATPSSTPTAQPTKEPTQKSEPQLAVLTPIVSLSKTRGAVGTSVTVTISGFPAATTVNVNWDSSRLNSVRTDSAGKATITIKVPAAVAGRHRITIAGGGTSKSAIFTVTPRIRLSPNNGPTGSTVRVTLSGHGRSEVVYIYWGST